MYLMHHQAQSMVPKSLISSIRCSELFYKFAIYKLLSPSPSLSFSFAFLYYSFFFWLIISFFCLIIYIRLSILSQHYHPYFSISVSYNLFGWLNKLNFCFVLKYILYFSYVFLFFRLFILSSLYFNLSSINPYF